MNRNEQLAIDAAKLVGKHVPGFGISQKGDSALHSAIGKLVPKYRTNFWTTIGKTAWRPSGEVPQGAWAVVLHEGWHAIKQRGWRKLPWFLGYAFPFLPLPAPFRAREEFRAYCVSMAADFWSGRDIDEAYIDWLVEEFVGPNYLWMWPFRRKMRERFWAFLHDIRYDELERYPADYQAYLAEVRAFAERRR